MARPLDRLESGLYFNRCDGPHGSRPKRGETRRCKQAINRARRRFLKRLDRGWDLE